MRKRGERLRRRRKRKKMMMMMKRKRWRSTSRCEYDCDFLLEVEGDFVC